MFKPRMPSLSRRTWLRAAGVAVALPALPSLMPKAVRAGGARPPKRFVSLFFPNGSTLRQDWQLSGAGRNYTMGTAHDALLPYQSQLSMFTGLSHQHGTGSPAHARGTAEFLTGAPISNQNTPEVDISIDQAIADHLRPNTAIRSLHLGPTPYAGGPPADTGWASGYNTSISWASMTQPNAPLESAQVAFDQVYVPSGTDPEQAAKRRRMQQSILDHTLDQIDAIEPRLGASDAAKLDEYLTAVREVEAGLQADIPDPSCGDGAEPPGDGLAFAEHTRAMLDVIVLAMQCDATRIITYSMDYGFGNKGFSFLGKGNGLHHNLSHSGSTPEIIANHKAIVIWYMEQFAYLLGRLDAVGDGDTSLLDESVVYFGSSLGDAWGHSHNDVNMMLAGGGGGALDPGRLIDASGADYGAVLLALAHAMDAPLPSFAGVSEPFAGL